MVIKVKSTKNRSKQKQQAETRFPMHSNKCKADEIEEGGSILDL
jgi:hypothetical protein